MLYKALVSFSGKISMMMDEVSEIADSSLVDDLLKAGYIEPVEQKEMKKKRKERKDEDKSVKTSQIQPIS